MNGWIDRFVEHLSVERNRSAHTCAAYRRDLGEFHTYLAARGATDLAALSSLDHLQLRGYLAELHKRNQRTSIARKLSTLRTFFASWSAMERSPGIPPKDWQPPGATATCLRPCRWMKPWR